MSDERSYIGTAFGNYQVTTELGSGGFGKVYQGAHTILTERTVAIKLLHAHLGEPEERERFLEEARLLERLKHPYIVHIFDVGIHEGFPYLVAEYAPHGSLRNLLKRYAPHPVPIPIALNVLTQIGQALSYAHQRNIIHRDLKPENILFNAQGAALLADFGIATTLSTSSIKQVNVVGTPAYMAPEQFQSTISKESDQYGLACIAYELFTGQLPFSATDFFSIGFQHIDKPPIAPTQLNANLPPHIEQAILKGMAKQRHARHADINAFIIALHTPVDAPAQSSISMLSTMSLLSGATVDATDAFSTLRPGSDKNSNQHISHQNAIGLDASSSLAALYPQVPETPLPPVYPSFSDAIPTRSSSPHRSYQQGPLTPLPTSIIEAPSAAENVTLLPSMNTPSSPSQQIPMVAPWPIIGGSSPYANGITPTPYPVKQRKGRYPWLLTAVAALLVVASLVGVLFFAFPPKSTSVAHGLSLNIPTAGVTPGVSVTAGLSPVATGASGASHHIVLTPTHNQTPEPGVTSTTVGVTVTRTHGVTPTTVTPTPTPMTAYFTAGETAVTTTQSYSGTVSITVSGVGQASQTQYSDAFYRYTDNYGTPTTTPGHPSCWVLYINQQDTDNFVINGSTSNIPAYNSSHVYTFTMTAPGGQLTFGVCDYVTSDNTGAYTITVTQK